jgi:hypothetical protein
MTPVVLHVLRPYSSEDEYLAAEAWTIEARGMLLVGQREVELDRAVVFDVALANGAKVIRAEGRAVGYQAASEDHPGGLRIRFRRFGSQTKAFIDRALSTREQTLAASASSPPPAAPAPEPLVAAAEPLAAAPEPLAAAPEPAPVTPSFSQLGLDPIERSGVHRRPSGPVDTPANREELLSRLRKRAAKAASVLDDSEQDQRAAEHG